MILPDRSSDSIRGSRPAAAYPPRGDARPRLNVGAILSHLYAGEFHFALMSVWDAGWYADIAGPGSLDVPTCTNGPAHFDTLDLAVAHLARRAIELARGKPGSDHWRLRMEWLLTH